MKAFRKWQGLVLVATIFALMLGTIAPDIANAGQGNPRIATIQSHPYGKTYGEWAAEWWQWALGTPASVNPVLDETGEFCAEGQEGHVWFLAGSFGVGGFERECTVPSGTSLFFPLINSFYGAFLNDPPETRTEEYIRDQAHCETPTELFAEIDGVQVKNPLQYFEKSPVFDVQLPEDNIFGVGEEVIPELLLSPSVDEGYYLFLRPLPPGRHNIYWKATWFCPSISVDVSEEVTYELTVVPRGRYGK